MKKVVNEEFYLSVIKTENCKMLFRGLYLAMLSLNCYCHNSINRTFSFIHFYRNFSNFITRLFSIKKEL